MKSLIALTSVRHGFVSVLLTAVLLAMAACSSGPPPSPQFDIGQGDYHLGPGDKVAVKVFGDETLSGSHQLDGNGTFTFPLIGTIKASGQTSFELENTLRSKLKEFLNDPRVAVEVESYRPFYIIGEVQKPGSYPYVNGMTVINAVAIAGGFTYRAKDDAFDIRRRAGDKSNFVAGQTTQVRPGDVIVVRERFF